MSAADEKALDACETAEANLEIVAGALEKFANLRTVLFDAARALASATRNLETVKAELTRTNGDG